MTPEDTRAASLATTSLEHFQANRREDAVRLLREALSLSPQNPIVLSTFAVLQEDANTPPTSKLIHKCVINSDEPAGHEALRLLRDPNAASLRNDTTVECLELLMSTPTAPLAGKLLGELLRVSRGAREHVALKLCGGIEDVMKVFDTLGEEAIDGVVAVLLDGSAWEKDSSTHSNCLRECFKWLLSRLAGTTSDRRLCVARSVARLLASKAEELHPFVSQSGLEQLLNLLDATSPPELRSHATLGVAKFADAAGDVGQSMIGKFVAFRLAADEDEDLRLAYSVAAAIFPLVPQFAATLFLTEGFVEGIVPSLQARPEDVEAAALDMLSAACVDKTCRTYIATHCTEYLEALVKSGDQGKSTAAVVLAKVKYTPGEGKDVKQKDMDKLASVFKGMMLTSDAEVRDSSVEGLAYTSLKGSVKEMLIRDKKFVTSLVETLQSSSGKPTVMFGALTVVNNLTAYAPTLSEEQQKVAQLKNYAETKPHAKVGLDPEDKDERVTPRCKTLLDADIIPALVACSKKLTPNAIGIISHILLSLSKHQKHRGLIASQGGVKLSLKFYSSTTSNGSDAAQQSAIRRTSAHALARILVSVNPSHVFSSQLAISSAIRPLYHLLEDSEEHKDLMPLFEALLALTNLASTEDTTRDHIIRLAWTKIEELLLNDNVMIQRATVELICNLMASPTAVAKFADGSAAASNRLHILLALADAQDLATRRAAGGALAMLTEWDKACEAVVKRERGVKIVLGMVSEEGEEMRHRGVVVLKNLVCGPGAYVDEVKKEGGVEVLREALKSTRQPEVLGLGVETLKALMGVN
ncbi:myosin-binding striated muscle assembly central-domain-containing protein [Tricharina praecox]|uniref:myosin-binding striated muscle assembly central-domain-containing protein n=1 Tax=Tricharina praecox TaxID=43433 RepID=UPI002220864A|nr:myosin-binding striated muscle assembly central-domain-containing protein [Tricharina praecox]KAI5846896.1 myosin-binding striated muscle assembly central-domain-containing protein [Tricharina praecox]